MKTGLPDDPDSKEMSSDQRSGDSLLDWCCASLFVRSRLVSLNNVIDEYGKECLMGFAFRHRQYTQLRTGTRESNKRAHPPTPSQGRSPYLISKGPRPSLRVYRTEPVCQTN